MSEEILFKFKNDVKNIELRDEVINSYKKNRKMDNLVEKMKKDLDKMGNGWVVISGNKMLGACSFIEDTLVEFEVEGREFIVFQIFIPVNE